MELLRTSGHSLAVKDLTISSLILVITDNLSEQITVCIANEALSRQDLLRP